MSKHDFVFSGEAARRLARAARASERRPVVTTTGRTSPKILLPSRYMIVTTLITAAVRASNTLGKGAGTLQLVTYNAATDVATYAALQTGVLVYSGALSTIATGRLIQVVLVDGRYHVVSDYC